MPPRQTHTIAGFNLGGTFQKGVAASCLPPQFSLPGPHASAWSADGAAARVATPRGRHLGSTLAPSIRQWGERGSLPLSLSPGSQAGGVEAELPAAVSRLSQAFAEERAREGRRRRQEAPGRLAAPLCSPPLPRSREGFLPRLPPPESLLTPPRVATPRGGLLSDGLGREAKPPDGRAELSTWAPLGPRRSHWRLLAWLEAGVGFLSSAATTTLCLEQRSSLSPVC
ncbi:uncharacterized protein LOC133371980 [Rhineura floridana]|uniref:uncharacterized protein LOC133371980 n=1 Tax=Rhineura floridana TaxID=261503 RepID=UPI002AC8708F|nr:uncharacterized protein LOC133371980 [Rhineura floridana]